MKSILVKAIIVFAIASMTSCITTLPKAASSHPIGTKKGISSTYIIFGVDLNFKYGVEEAIKSGKITGPISIIDEKYSNFILFEKRELIVIGE